MEEPGLGVHNITADTSEIVLEDIPTNIKGLRLSAAVAIVEDGRYRIQLNNHRYSARRISSCASRLKTFLPVDNNTAFGTKLRTLPGNNNRSGTGINSGFMKSITRGGTDKTAAATTGSKPSTTATVITSATATAARGAAATCGGISIATLTR